MFERLFEALRQKTRRAGSKAAPPPRRRPALTVEALEERAVPATTIRILDGAIRIEHTAGHDTASVREESRPDGRWYFVTASGHPSMTYHASSVWAGRIDYHGYEG